MIYDFITSMYFAGMTLKYMIPLSRAKEPEIFRDSGSFCVMG